MNGLIIIFLLTGAANQFALQPYDVTPVQILSPEPMQFGPFCPSAVYKEMAGETTPGVSAISAIRDMNSLVLVYSDTVFDLDFNQGEEKTVSFELADLEPGGYVIVFWAEKDGANISHPPDSLTFGYAEAVGEEPLPHPSLPVISSQPYFSSFLEVSFHLAEPSLTSVDLYDASGCRVMRLVEESLNPGFHLFSADARGLSKGEYFVRLSCSVGASAQKVIKLH